MIDLPRRLLESIHDSIQAFETQGLKPPTCMWIGEDIQLMLLAAGSYPRDGSWGTIYGMELRGVSDDLQRRLDYNQAFYIHLRDTTKDGMPEYSEYIINQPFYRQEFLGKWLKPEPESKE